MKFALVCTVDTEPGLEKNGSTQWVKLFETEQAAEKYATDMIRGVNDYEDWNLEEFQDTLSPTEYFYVMPVVD